MWTRLSHPIVNLTNKVAIVTGGNGGIGYETSKALAVMGAHTIIACRSEERALTVCYCISMDYETILSFKCSFLRPLNISNVRQHRFDLVKTSV